MRIFLWALTLAIFTAATASAQLLEDGKGREGVKPGPGNVGPGADADANVKANANANAGGNGQRVAAAPQANAMFAVLDADGDGTISKVELRKAIKALRTLDTDEDGNITLAEASAGAAPAGPGGPLDNPQIAQVMANDRNGDGRLTPNEVPNELMPMLQQADRNGDRAIDRQELAAAMANMQNQFGQGFGGPWRGPLNGPNNGRGDQAATGQFLRYDANRDGKLSEDELPQNAKRMLKDADADGDGSLDAGELQAALAKLGDRSRMLRAGLDPEDAGGRGVNKRNGNQR